MMIRLIACLLLTSVVAPPVKPVVSQSGGVWTISIPVKEMPTSVVVDGMASNSRIKGWSTPRRVVSAWPKAATSAEILDVKFARDLVILTLSHAEGNGFRFDPLLGPRDITLVFGKAASWLHIELKDDGRTPHFPFPPIPDERLDPEIYFSPPHSLWVDASDYRTSYRFGDVPVRPGARYRLTFRYCVAVDSEGAAMLSVTQYSDLVQGWLVVHEAGSNEALRRTGKWERYSRVVTIADRANSVAVAFRMQGDVGTMWVDDLEFRAISPEAKP